MFGVDVGFAAAFVNYALGTAAMFAIYGIAMFALAVWGNTSAQMRKAHME